MKHILSLSGGKDSTAMLLHILELLDSGDDSYPLDEVVFADTGLEFPEMYEHLDKLRKEVVEHDIKWTVLMPEHPFEYYLYEHERVGKDGTVHHGYGWAGARTRWCTWVLKTAMTDRMMQDKKSIWYTGIACDESHRLLRKINRRHVHPLVDWGWTEEMCLQYCYSHGYDWGGLYEHYNRGLVLVLSTADDKPPAVAVHIPSRLVAEAQGTRPKVAERLPTGLYA